MLTFVLAEAALELVPKEVRRTPAVLSDSKRREKDPGEILLDRSFHHASMLRLKESEKRGRPDLVHAALLSVTGTPLYLDGEVRLLVHSRDDAVLEFEPMTRIPKNYLRFRGLMEKVLAERPAEGLVRVSRSDIAELVKRRVKPARVVGLSVQGKSIDLRELGKELSGEQDVCVLVGGFPHGHFSADTLSVIDELVRIDSRPLEAHVVAARVVYEAERARRESTIKSQGGRSRPVRSSSSSL